MNEKNFLHISPRDHAPRALPKKGMDRRKFLQAGAAALATTLAGDTVLDLAQKINKPHDHNVQKDLPIPPEYSLHTSPSQEHITITQDDTEVLGKTFTEQIRTQDSIALDEKTRTAIYHAWYEKYKPGTYNYVHGILAGLTRMEPWITEIREIFRTENVPEEFMYLAIAESHFTFDDTSAKGAVGPYQITENTARLKDLETPITITENYDERRDPIASAHLCARHLRYSFKKFGNDWDLALMDYNGGFTNEFLIDQRRTEEKADIIPRPHPHILKEYETLSDLALHYNTSITLLKKANAFSNDDVRKLQIGDSIILPQEREPINFENFNIWIQDRINQRVTTELYKSTYTVHPGDTTSAIAQKFHMPRALLESLNNISESFITEGQELHIPKLFNDKRNNILNILHEYKENINYPEKYKAIRDIIKKNGLNQLWSPEKKKLRKARIPKTSRVSLHHTIDSRENITSIAQKIVKKLQKKYPKFNGNTFVVARMLILENKISDPQIIKAGDTLSLTIPIEKQPTLYDIAYSNNISPNNLIDHNPSVINPHKEVPSTAVLRFSST